MTHQESNVARRLRALIYRMARKTAYLPHALRIPHPSISNKRPLGAGGFGVVTMAQMNGKNVAIKKVLGRNHTTQRQCHEVWISFEWIPFMQTKIRAPRCSPAKLSCGVPYDTRILFHFWVLLWKALSTLVWSRHSTKMVTFKIA